MNVGNGFPQLIRQHSAFYGPNGHGLADILCVFSAQLAKDHFRVLYEVGVECESVLRRGQLYPFRHVDAQAFALLQEQDVRHHAGVGVAQEGVVRQTDGSQQIRAGGNVPAHGVVLLVHGAAGGDDSHDAAGP